MILQENSMHDVTVRLDAKGLNCPLPILKSKLELNKMKPGQILFVEATDPHSKIDFEAYCARSGHEIVNFSDNAGVFSFTIKRAENPENF